MSSETVEQTIGQFGTLPDSVKVALVLIVYSIVAIGLVSLLDLEGSAGGFTGFERVYEGL